MLYKELANEQMVSACSDGLGDEAHPLFDQEDWAHYSSFF
jgi:hypothetical protein